MSQAPKRKTSKSKRNMRRAHDFLTPVLSSTCPNCGASVLSHHVCRECGYYRGRKLLNTKEA
ncbi:MAG: 50S ribosomal protein L32 [Deltaproteobacteria bacterium]|jgi:large subunit ribosomal protein L32|nr:50S ribosomal protein L32 [Deltaproteobacteria bacterium]